MVDKVIATPAALELVAFLQAKHGPALMFHQSGGCCDGSSPMCFPQDDFIVGDNDVQLGEIGGAPFYISRPQFEYWKHTQLIIDVVEGRGGMFSLENGEGVQVLNYQPGAEYKPHYDYFDPAAPGTPTILKRGGQRVGTLVMYLNNPERGGGTTFPDVGLEVAPQRGNAVFFSYDRPHPSSQTLHGGAPVVSGEKWVATKWLREREFV